MSNVDTMACIERGEHVATQRHPESECPWTRVKMDDRLRLAFCNAVDAQQHCRAARVQIHLGKNIVRYLESFVTTPDARAVKAAIWGYPVIIDENDHDGISVHAVTVIA